MKVLHIITSLRTGGAEHLLVDLLPELRTLDAEVELLVFDGTDSPFMQQIKEAGITVHHLGNDGNVYNPLNIFRLAKHIRRYDIIHTHNTACQLFAPLARLLTLGSAHLITTEHNTSNRRRGKWMLKLIDKWMYRQYKSIICISNKAEANLKHYLQDNTLNISTIYNGIKLSRFIDAMPLESLLPEYTDSKKIIMVARFSEQKDQDTLIRATKLLPDNFHTIFVGNGVRLEKCQQLADSEGVSNRTHFLGLRSDIPQLLKSCNYIVMSSHYEGLSLSSIEGMCSGRPFIASDVDGLHEITSNNGILFEHQNAEALANAIIELDSSPQKYSAVAASCIAKALQYDIKLTAKQYFSKYSALCKN